MSDKTLPFSLSQVEKIAERYPTPFYLYDKEAIIRRVRQLQQAFAWAPGFREHFAVKALPNPVILQLLHSLGCGTDCASPTELILSQRAGICGKEIIFSSNETSAQEYQAAMSAGAILNLDDVSHVDFLASLGPLPDTICCRYNPGQFQITGDIMGHLYDSKFGMTKPQLFAAFSRLRELGVKHFGLHAMLASCSLQEEYYPRLAGELFSLAVEIHQQLGICVEFIDLSGGIGIPYRPEEQEVDIFAIGAGVRQAYQQILQPDGLAPRLMTELGRYITGPCGYLITKVLHHKDIYKRYVGVDATACNLMRPAMYGAYHHITVLGKENAPCDTVADVVGSLCENNDKFAVDRPLPLTQRGDLLAIHDTGAHGYSMGYNYNGKLRCAELLWEGDDRVKMIRRAETPEDYFATLDILPEYGGGKNA